jgi:hypothetical protein
VRANSFQGATQSQAKSENYSVGKGVRVRDMNIHTLNTVGFWPVRDHKGNHVATVWGTWEAAQSLLELLLPAGTVALAPAKTADEASFRVGSVTPGNC